MPVTTAEPAYRPGFPLLLRTGAVHDALQCLAACVERQAVAQLAFDAAASAVAREQDAATRSAGDEDVEAFAAWLPAGLQAVDQAGNALEQAAQSAAAARAVLRLARAAAAAQIASLLT